jgi:hypothetical protein
MTVRRALVVGSYPPVPGAPAAATVAAVRRAWEGGAEVVVVSPRPSAAPFVVPLTGPALGRELAKLRVAHGCDELVLCLEPGWPFARSARSGPAAARTARSLAEALGGFERAEVVVTGELGVAPEVFELLWGHAKAHVRTVIGSLVPGPVADQTEGVARVGPLEPTELLVVARGRRALGQVARKVLGSHAPAVRLHLRRLLR